VKQTQAEHSDLKTSHSYLTIPSLRYSILDGLGGSISQGSGETYLSAFGIFLKAAPLQVGLLATLPPLIGALLQGFGVWLMERFLRRRQILVILAAILSLIWLPVALLPVVLGPGGKTVTILILLICLYFALAGFAAPIWNSLIGDLVPSNSRGRYFGFRSRKCGLAVFLAMILAGQVLHIFEKAGLAEFGFLLIFLMAAFGRVMSSYWLSKYDDPPLHVSAEDRFSFIDFLRRAPASNFAKFAFFIATINLAVNFAGPYFAVYMLRQLNFSYLQYTLIGASAVIAQFLTLQHWGYLCDRFGNKKILNVTAVGVALSPIMWLFSAQTWYLVLIQLYGGFVWAGFNLAVGNFLFDAVSPPKRARCAAYQAIINGIFVLCGALLGGWYASHVPAASLAEKLWILPPSVYFQLFLISGLMRLAAAAVFLPLFAEVRPVEAIHHPKLIFQILHLRPLSGATFGPLSNGREKRGKTSPSMQL